MILYPAIDILEGSAVRLVKGDFDAKKVYDEDPLAAARGWTEEGARYLHVVDLDGAKTGAPVNLEHLRRIAGELGVPVQYGGGLRSMARRSTRRSAAGAERVILGTAVFTSRRLLWEALGEHGPERVLVSVDVRGGTWLRHGWLEDDRDPARGSDRKLEREQGAASSASSSRTSTATGCSTGLNREEVATVARAAGDGQRDPTPAGSASSTDLDGLAELAGEQQLKLGRRDRRQGALRAPLYGRGGPGGARWLIVSVRSGRPVALLAATVGGASEACDPLPRREMAAAS